MNTLSLHDALPIYGQADGWSVNGHATRTTAVVHSGNAALRYHARLNTSYNGSQRVANLQPGVPYAFSAWVNIPATSDAFSFRLLVQWRSGSTLVRAGSAPVSSPLRPSAAEARH